MDFVQSTSKLDIRGMAYQFGTGQIRVTEEEILKQAPAFVAPVKSKLGGDVNYIALNWVFINCSLTKDALFSHIHWIKVKKEE